MSSDSKGKTAFGQYQTLTTTLKTILQDYQPSQLLSEQLQNADDAGSRVFAVNLDVNYYGKEKLASPALADWQGPALCCFDDAEFSANDLASICRVGEGSKQLDPTKTGQFGLGFNSCYYITDTPSFITGKKFALFDPHASHGLNGCGALFDLDKTPDDHVNAFAASFPEYFDGKHWLTKTRKGTIFRFPLRTEKNVSLLRPNNGQISVDECWTDVVEPFLISLPSSLLFLNSVQRVRVYRGGELIREAHSTICNTPDKNPRAQLFAAVHERWQMGILYKKPIPNCTSYELELSLTEGTKKSTSRWLIAMKLATEMAALSFCAQVLKHHSRALLPYAAVALPLLNSEKINGRLYVTLPTPLYTGFPLHIDARYELSRDRNALRVVSTAVRGKYRSEKLEHARAHWNGCLMPELIAAAYTNALISARQSVNSYLPVTTPAIDHFTRPIVDSLYGRLMKKNPCILHTVVIEKVLTSPADALYIRRHSPNDVEDFRQTTDCAHILATIGCPIVCLDSPQGFLNLSKDDRLFSPSVAAAWLRRSGAVVPVPSAQDVLAYILRGIQENDEILVGVHTITRRDFAETGAVVAIDDSQQKNTPLYLDDDIGSGAMLLGHRSDLFVSDACAKLLLSLGHTRLPRFSISEHALPLLLPAHWRGRRTASRDAEQTLLLRKIWRAIAALSRVDREQTLARLGEWPLIPCAGNEVANLDAAILLPNPLTLSDESDDLAVAALAALGVLVADVSALDSFDIIQTTSLLSAEGVLDALNRLGKKSVHDWSAIGFEARDALLSVIGRDFNNLDDERADFLAQLPLFSSYGCECRVPLCAEINERFQFPTNGFVHTFDDDTLLYENLLNKPKNQFHALIYARLGVRELPLAVLWRRLLDERRWCRLSINYRLELLKGLRRDYELMIDQYINAQHKFADWLADTPLLWCDDNPSELFPLSKALDPQEPLHSRFWPRRLPPAELSTFEWLPFLTRAGLRLKVARESIFEAATLVDQSSQRGKVEADDVEKAKLIVDALFSATSTAVMPVLDEAWLEKIGKLRFAQARYTKSKLVAFCGNVCPFVGALREHYSSFSRRTIISLPSITPRVTVIRALGAYLSAPFEDVAHHLVYLAKHHSSTLSEDSSEPAEYQLSLVEQLGCCYESLGYGLLQDSDTEKKDRLQEIIKDIPIIALRKKQRSHALQMVKPVQIFFKLPENEDAIPYAYSLDRACDAFVSASTRTPIAKYLGCGTERPSFVQIKKWLQSIVSPVSDPKELEAAVALAKMVFKYYGDNQMKETLLLPDEYGIMRAATEICCFDVPWLSERLDRSKLQIVSSKLDSDIAKFLGAKPLSRVLVERSVGQYSAATEITEDEIFKWQHNLRSCAFAAALRRVSSTQQEKSNHLTIHTQRLLGLREAEIRPTTILRSRFFLYERDVTKEEIGSQAIIVIENSIPIVYILVKSSELSEYYWQRRCKAAIGIALDRFLGPNVIRDRAIVGELLSVSDVIEMNHILDMYEVPSFELDLRLGSSWESEEDGLSLEPIDDAQRLSVGDLVIVNNLQPAVYGKALSFQNNSWLVAVAPDLSEVREIKDSVHFVQPRAVARKEAQPCTFYRGARGWESTEAAARARIVQRQRNAAVENEPEGIDDILVMDNIVNPKLSQSKIQKVVRKTRISPGFDLVRIGNFPRRGCDGAKEVAYFHHKTSVYQVYEDPSFQCFIKQCCVVLDDVSSSVFGYDTALIALFYQPNAVSRFVRQKLLFHVYPIEQFKKKLNDENPVDIRRYAYPYCYFFGLCVHKLAHFFDVVHGTRHEFFMNEYRVHYALHFIQLLIRRGFDPESVEREYGHLIHSKFSS